MIKFAPPDIASARSICEKCKAEFPVPLDLSYQHSLAPVIPRDFDERTNNKFWQSQSTEIQCPVCSAKTLLKLPTKSELGKVLFFGDDAARKSEIGNIFCFSLVGGNKPFVDRIEQELNSLKSRFEPDLDPESWHIHMKILHSGDQRKKNLVFQSWEKLKIESFVAEVFELIRRNSADAFIFSVSFASDSKSSLAELKRDCYLALIADLIYGFSKLGFTPILHFDSEKEFIGLGPIIHGWARDAFQGSQRQLIYSYISHGLPVPEPLFLRPASHPCLELADFVSFVIARGHHCKMNGLPIDYESERLGIVFYSWLRRDGHYGRDRQIGFPWREIYD